MRSKRWREACSLGLPITLRSTQYEDSLKFLEPFRSLPYETSPHVFGLDGTKDLSMLDLQYPSDEPFYDLGVLWGQTSRLATYQNICPDPSAIMFLSNNESRWIRPYQLGVSKRFVDEHGNDASNDVKQQVLDDLLDANLANNWPTGHKSPLHRGIQDTLPTGWQDKAFFVGFTAVGPRFYGRWWGWWNNSSPSNMHLTTTPGWWDGGSGDYYLDNWSHITDYRVWSVQTEVQNWVFMKEKALEMDPNYWFELSSWDGGFGSRKDKLSRFVPFNEHRYKAIIQFGLWVLRPRMVREFRSYHQPLEDNESYFQAVLDAIRPIHENNVLRQFWRTWRAGCKPKPFTPLRDFSSSSRH